jgi:hypothetical protein
LNATALVSIPVGVVVERIKAKSAWLDYVWRPVSILVGEPSAQPWTVLNAAGDSTLFYGGTATIDLYRTESENYLSNIESESPLLWVVLRPTDAEPPYEVVAVTADPAEGEASTEAGNNIVETVEMPAAVAAIVQAFIVEHHVERPFYKRQRDDDARRNGPSKGGGGSDRGGS